jgi:acyl-CoA thioesterase FadM
VTVTIGRTVEWQDTDAAGHYHHSTVIRWVEAAESALYSRLGLDALMGAVPRVRYEVDYVDRLFFNEEVAVSLSVATVGGTSASFTFEVLGPRGLAARGRMVIAHTGGTRGRAARWPAGAREALTAAL